MISSNQAERFIELEIFNDLYIISLNEEYSEKFLSNINIFTSDIIFYIYKKGKKYSEAFNLLEYYINDLGMAIPNKESRNLL